MNWSCNTPVNKDLLDGVLQSITSFRNKIVINCKLSGYFKLFSYINMNHGSMNAHYELPVRIKKTPVNTLKVSELE